MPQPRLFLHCPDPLLTSRLLKLPRMRQFTIVQAADSGCWVEQLERSNCDAGILCLSELTSNQEQRLQQQQTLHTIDFMVLSSGAPNPDIDNLLVSKAGYHYRQPYNFAHIEATLDDFYRHACDVKHSVQHVLHSDLEQFGMLLGASDCMRQLYRMIRKVAPCEAHVLVVGESGAGKELVANTLHCASLRNEQPFVAINCGALSAELIDSELFGHVKGAFTGAIREHKGVFEQAQGGTLFLDEVTEMPLEQQVKLLRVLETGEYRRVGGSKVLQTDVRVVAATNRDPIKAIEDGVFREDLYFRLAQFPIQVPPLRERGKDIEGLARHFLAYRNSQQGTQKAISERSIQRIIEYPWPGNVRELKHALERAFILADDVIEPRHLLFQQVADQSNTFRLPLGMPLRDLEAAAIQQTLAANQGNKRSSAEQLGISVKTLYNKLEKFHQ